MDQGGGVVAEELVEGGEGAEFDPSAQGGLAQQQPGEGGDRVQLAVGQFDRTTELGRTDVMPSRGLCRGGGFAGVFCLVVRDDQTRGLGIIAPS